MKKMFSLITLVAVCYCISFSGCAWPNHKTTDTVEGQPANSKWLYTGVGTGLDPRAKEIESRLGYE